MFGLVSKIVKGLIQRSRQDGIVVEWLRDPLSHPALLAMDQVQLGDLPHGARSCCDI